MTPTAQSPVLRGVLQLHVIWTEPQYGNQDVKGEALIFRGLPLEIELTLANPFDEIDGGAHKNWLNDVSIDLLQGDRFLKNAPVVATTQCGDATLLASVAATEDDTRTLVQPKGYVTFRCTLSVSPEIAAGPYVLRASWAQTETPFVKNVADSLHPAMIQLELREAASAVDALDRDLHVAGRAIEDGEFAAALEIAGTVLQRDSQSAFARVLRGRAFQRMGNCSDARREWLLAAQIMTSEAGGSNRRITRKVSSQQRREAAAGWRESALKLPCK